MALELTALTQLDTLPFDDIIDVRAPAEFAADRVPGAINLPVLSDEERARVGTHYVQVSRFEARKIGAALVAQNAARHLQGPLADRPGAWRPLIYCWRGGQRSGSFASILSQIGWRVDTIAGGYRTYRRLVVAAMHDTPLPHPLILLDGNTGTAKTEILAHLAKRGHQTLDLEALACHRGSVFGAHPGGQPSQKAFEGALAMAIARLDPAHPVVVEAESSKIGALQLPPSLWAAMRAAPRLALSAPVTARAAYLVRSYGDIAADSAALTERLDALRPLRGHATVDAWQSMAAEGRFTDLASALVAEHYDPRYAKSRSRSDPARSAELRIETLTEGGIAAALPRIEHALTALHKTTRRPAA